MKKTLFIFNILLTAALLTGCDDLLDVAPKTDLTDSSFWKSEADLKGACNRMYEQLAFGHHDVRADDQVTRYGANTTSTGTWTVPAESADWTDPYKRIFTANNIIIKAAEAPLGEKIRNKYLAEAHFFRAYNFFDLVCKYGDVPLLLKVVENTSDPDLKMGRTPREDVIQQCYKDLEYAAEWLPTRATLQGVANEFDRRRVTRSSALGLMVRIGLHEGTMQKYHNLGSEAQWKAHLQKAISAYNLLTAEGHALYTNGGTAEAYQALFFDEAGSSNREVLFAKAYGPNGGSGSGYTNHGYSGDSEGTFGLTRAMVDTYLYANGLPREKQTLTTEESFNTALGYEADGVTPLTEGGRDPRLAMTVWRVKDPQDNDTNTVGGMLVGGFITSGKNAYIAFDPQRPMGYQLKKCFAGLRWGANRDYTDRIIIRWGEMLVSYAEALYELNDAISDTQLDETVNALRARAGFDAKLTNGFATANGLDIREEIRRERTVELMAENRRYADIIRWKIAETVLPKAVVGLKFIANNTESYNGVTLNADPVFTSWLTDADGKLDGVQEYGYPEPNVRIIEKASSRRFNPAKDYYYPIPTFEIAQSDGNIKQNDGWK